MIKKWLLNNFKSIDKEKEFEFRPLTIFTGANSSGKSTILQSILLVTQTIQSHNPSKAVVLNGHIKKFGTYEDIVNHRDDTKNITIGFELKNDNLPVIPKKVNRSRHFDEIVTGIDCKIEISTDGAPDCVMPLLNKFSCKTSYTNENTSECTVVRIPFSLKKPEDQDAIAQISNASSYDVFNYELAMMNGHANVTSATRNPCGRVLGVGFQHFLPSTLIMYQRLHDMYKDYVKGEVMRNFLPEVGIKSAERTKIKNAVKPVCIEIAERLIKENSNNPLTEIAAQELESLKKRFSFNTFSDILYWLCPDERLRMRYLEQIMKPIESMKDDYHLETVGVELADTNKIAIFFDNHIKYLAPLREEPRALYPIDTNGDLTDVGLRGENTAAVYQNYQSKTIEYIPSSAFKNLETESFVPKKVTFAKAVNEWLEYLGVAAEINTNDKGKFGHELKIQTEKGFEQDLTHVGVGASQVLPILVMALLAKRGEVIILEQPELHLHPKVQTRLADFFVSMNALGKQCIIETHSEYMINRLRYLVAVNDTSKVADDTMIYFVEKHDGHSEYRPITINKYGVIEEWPEGFFDESENLAAQILRAGMEKKMREEGDEEDDE